MSLIERIRADQLAARKMKAENIAPLLTTLLGEAQMVGKNDGNRESTDAEVVAVIKKFIKNIDILLEQVGSSPQHEAEKAILARYLPTQIGESYLVIMVSDYAQEHALFTPKDMGKIMKHFKQHYAGHYDGKMLSKVVKQFLSNA